MDVLVDYTTHAVGAENVTAAVERGCAVVMGASGLTTDDFQDIDYAAATTPDSSSGTARELAERLAEVHPPQVEMLIDDVAGAPEPRGTNVRSTQVHSVRLPSFVVSTEMLFALPDERLSIRHDAGSPPQPYVTGTLLAVRAVTDLVGVVRGWTHSCCKEPEICSGPECNHPGVASLVPAVAADGHTQRRIQRKSAA